ncbi:MAG TPA: SAM-dependent methyltransferase [Thermohalobaculum sp.]|nr:SAM-dependent methyltransferase [Thermohalobaculum sp.]
MTALRRIIARQIRASGPMTVADYMAVCLSHPRHGYYATRDPFGAAGDFTTAPEISQMFGEMVGLWLAERWQVIGCPAPVRLVELGPGRGTLMADVLRTARRVPGWLEAADPWLVETSPTLRALQAERVPRARWADSIEAVPEGPLLLVANEFFDALPVRQFLRSAQGWRETLVGLDGEALAWGLSDPLPERGLPADLDWREVSPSAEHVAAAVARRIGAHGGAALVIDYGYTAADRPPGPTLQAVRGHARAEPLAEPGEADLTWLPDFDWLGRAFAPLATATTTQGAFLRRLGIGARAEALARAAPDSAGTVADALERLAGPGMGDSFRVLAAWPDGAPAPPGFEDVA